MKNYKVIAADEEIMKTASDTFFRQLVECGFFIMAIMYVMALVLIWGR